MGPGSPGAAAARVAKARNHAITLATYACIGQLQLCRCPLYITMSTVHVPNELIRAGRNVWAQIHAAREWAANP